MDANGARFHLLIGCDDWGRCTFQDTPLAQLWSNSPASARVTLEWDPRRQELTLRKRVDRFIAGRNDNPPTISDRRGVDCDRYGNWYWIDKDQQRIRVLSAGSGLASDFWPATVDPPATRHGDFQDTAAAPREARQLSGLAITKDHYLVVGTVQPAGLLLFDLFGGAGPIHLLWPAGVEVTPFDLAARPSGGVAVLDSIKHRFWVLDRGFRLLRHGIPSNTPMPLSSGGFQPGNSEPPVETVQTEFLGGIPIEWGSPPEPIFPIAIEVLPDESIIILDRGDEKRYARILRYVGTELKEVVSTESIFERLEVEDRLGVVLQAHDFAFLPGNSDRAHRVYVASSEGNQTFACTIDLVDDRMIIYPEPEYLPMRRFGGKGLVAGAGCVHYDFGERWLPLVAEHRPRFEETAELATPPLDGKEPGCVWHRLILDASIPSHANLRVRSRAADDQKTLLFSTWQNEPKLYLRRDGPELPWLGTSNQAGSAAEEGTWELLLQKAHGRFLQIELKLQGDRRSTPRLQALRVWYPRFSYLEHYLPAVYRAEEGPADFLDRFLANLEGFYTAIEDRIANAQVLFDIATTPAEALDWFGSWLGITLDPAWDEARRRRFIRHAMTLFQYRGTVHGIRLALQLALDDCIRASDLVPQSGASGHFHCIRIVEQYLTRRLPGIVFGEPLTNVGPRLVPSQPQWKPAEGGARLNNRYRIFLQETLGQADPGDEFQLALPCQADGEERRAAWRQFARQQLGFVPSLGEQERRAWQQFLEQKYIAVSALNQAHGTTYQDFGSYTLPRDWPATQTRRNDWKAYVLNRAEPKVAYERDRWQKFLARRYASIRTLNNAYLTQWPSFTLIPPPDMLPPDGPPLFDWHCYETTVRPIQAKAHHFLVFLATPGISDDQTRSEDRLALARRIIELEKPAHTTFDVRLYWAMFRVGEARLEFDTMLGASSRAPELMPPFILGRDHLGTGHVTQPGPKYTDRWRLEC